METLELAQKEHYEYQVLEAGGLPFEQLRALMDTLEESGWQLDGIYDSPAAQTEGGLSLKLWLKRERPAAA